MVKLKMRTGGMSLLRALRRLCGGTGENQHGAVLLPVLLLLAVAPLATIGFLRFTNATSELADEDRGGALVRYALEAGINDVITDLFDPQDILSPSYVPPSPTLNSVTVNVAIRDPDPTAQATGLYQYINPGVSFGLSSLSSQTHYFMQIDNVRPSTSLRVNWDFTPIRQRWKVKVYEGTGPPGAPAPTGIAADDFETGNLTGGTGWTGPWTAQGDAGVVSTGGPFEGSFHMRLRSGDGQVSRILDLSGQTNVRLQFWAKASTFDPGETATCSVSPDGVTFTVVRVWEDGVDDDGVYRFEDIDLSSFLMSSSFWIRCSSHMSATGDLFFVDDLKVVSQAVPAPLAELSDDKGPGGIFIEAAKITGGVYTIDFFNDSGTALVSGLFGTTGAADESWIYAMAFKDYVIRSTAGDTAIEVYARQVPGPTVPDTRQQVFIESWREP